MEIYQEIEILDKSEVSFEHLTYLRTPIPHMGSHFCFDYQQWICVITQTRFNDQNNGRYFHNTLFRQMFLHFNQIQCLQNIFGIVWKFKLSHFLLDIFWPKFAYQLSWTNSRNPCTFSHPRGHCSPVVLPTFDHPLFHFQSKSSKFCSEVQWLLWESRFSKLFHLNSGTTGLVPGEMLTRMSLIIKWIFIPFSSGVLVWRVIWHGCKMKCFVASRLAGLNSQM